MAHLTVKIVGADESGGAVALTDFVGFCRSLEACLHKVEKTTAESRMVYRIAEIKSGSIVMTLEATTVRSDAHDDSGSVVIEAFKETLRRLEGGKAPRVKLTEDDLTSFRELAAPLEHTKSISIGGISISNQLIATIEKLASIRIPVEGSVKGRLEQLNLHNRTQFVIFPPITTAGIPCVFDDALAKPVYKAINKSITVYGTLHFKPDKAFPEWVQARSIEIHPDNARLPKLADLRGTWKGCKGAKTAVEFLRSIRDE